MAGTPTATILVIAYKMEAMIAEAIRSALAQTVPCEIIVSDDCSPDGTLDAARKAIEGYEGPHRITVRSTPRNLGLCPHLTELAGLATGDVLVFQAGDDIAYPQRVQQLLETFAKHPEAQIVGSLVDDIDAHGKPIELAVRGTPFEIDQDWLLRRGKLAAVLGASMAIRRTLLTDFPPMAGMVEDNMLTLRAVLAGRCFCVQQALIGYRRHDANLGDWVFDRSANDAATYERRNRRVLAMYREIAADQRKCVAARPDLPEDKRSTGLRLADMYALEADMREAVLDQPRRRWLAPLWSGLMHPGLRRKSLERAVKLVLPRSAFGQGDVAARTGARFKDWNRRRVDARRIRNADSRGEGSDYTQWVAKFDTIDAGKRAAFKVRADKLPPLLIAVVMPVYNPKPAWLAEAIDSVIAQAYPHWELCIADDLSTDPEVIATLDAYAQRDKRIRVIHRTANGHISAASNSALEIVTAPWVTLLDHDDLLAEHALLCVAETIAAMPDAAMIYSDEDKIDEAHHRSEGFFKPDWNPELARAYNVFSHLGAYRTALLREVGGFRVGYEGAQDYDLMLRCVDRIAPTQIVHIPHVLYHWRIHAASTAVGNAVKPYALEAGRRALLEHLARNGLSGDVQPHATTGHYVVEYTPPAPLPKATVVIADPGDANALVACREALDRTGYAGLDVRVADSTPAAFNAAARESTGDIVVFLDGRCIPEDDTWLLRAVTWASQPNTGAIGGKLFDSEQHIIGSGALLGVDGGWSPMNGGGRADGYGSFGRAKVPQNVSALMHGLVAMKRSVFVDAGGLDETYATLTGVMLDLTLRIARNGLRLAWVPSLGMRIDAPGNTFDANDADNRKLEDKWSLSKLRDPAYNPNLSNRSKQYWYAHPPR